MSKWCDHWWNFCPRVGVRGAKNIALSAVLYSAIVCEAEQTQPVPKIAGTIDPPGVYEYVVVGYYGRETK